MNFLGLLKDLISIVVIANAVTNQKTEPMTEDYKESLEKILES